MPQPGGAADRGRLPVCRYPANQYEKPWGGVYCHAGTQGLYGPQGTGVLLCGDGQMPRPLLEGGTGSISLSQDMPDFLPDRIEAGTHNMPGIAGLLAGVRFVRRQGTPDHFAP